MKRTLIAICIGTALLTAGASAEQQQHQNRAAGRGKASATTSARVQSGAKIQGSRQVGVRQNVHRNTSARAFNQQATVNSRVNHRAAITRSNMRTDRVSSRERGFRRNRATANNTAITSNAVSRERFNRRNRVTANNNTVASNAVSRERFNRGSNIQRQRDFASNANRNITVNRTRNVTLVNNWRGAQFAGGNYVAFRNYHRSWHDRGWWDSHYGTSLTFVFGAPYFWNAGYWYPAWGYNPGYVYPYDGPIYGAATLTPDQIVMNVQAQLRDDGYYTGAIDGVLGPQTRYALAQFQADNGLAITSAVDEPTLATLGIS